jgi:protein SCO1/2
MLVVAFTGSVACSGEYVYRGVMIDPPRDIPGFSFTRPGGEVFSTGADGKHPTLLFFGYTNCPDVCPTTMADWARAKKALGGDGANVRYVFVTVDPERDTPAVADRYAKRFDSTFVGVSGDSATTAQIMAAFGVTAAREPSTDSTRYFVSHTAQAFLVDRTGRLVAFYTLGMGWEPLTADLKSLL